MERTVSMPEEGWERWRTKVTRPLEASAVVAYLSSRGYTHMVTSTSKRKRDAFEMSRAFLCCLADMSSALTITEALWVAERHPMGHGFHIHALWRSASTVKHASSRKHVPQRTPSSIASDAHTGGSTTWRRDSTRPHSTRPPQSAPFAPLRRRSNGTPSADVPTWRLAKEYLFRNLGIARVYPLADPVEAAVAYATKYLLKDIRRGDAGPPPFPWESVPSEPVWGIWSLTGAPGRGSLS